MPILVAIRNALKIVTFLKFVAILKNAGAIIGFFKELGPIIKSVSEGHKFPDCEESTALLKSASKLIRNGIIDIPGVEEADIANAIDQIVEQITCKTSI